MTIGQPSGPGTKLAHVLRLASVGPLGLMGPSRPDQALCRAWAGRTNFEAGPYITGLEGARPRQAR